MKSDSSIETTAPEKVGFLHLRLRPSRLLILVGLCATLGTLMGFLGAHHWLLDLFAHFRIQYFTVLLAIGAILFLLRLRVWAAVFVVMSAVNFALIAPFYWGAPTATASAGETLRALLINVNRRYGNPQKVLDTIRAYNPDIIVLQEVSASWLRVMTPALATDYPHSEDAPRDDNFGIAFWSRHPLPTLAVLYTGDFEVPTIIAELETPRGNCMILATHPVPPMGKLYTKNRNDQLAELARRSRHTDVPLVLMGDLNATPWSAAFKSLLRESGLKNASQGRGLYPTWPTFMPLLRIPIDHFLHTPDIGIVSRQTGPGVGSDHFPVIVDFTLPAPAKTVQQ